MSEVDDDQEWDDKEYERIKSGRNTCHDVGFAPYIFECSECGMCHLRHPAYVDMPRFCPHCGKVVIEDVQPQP